jgi:hypothetical protein
LVKDLRIAKVRNFWRDLAMAATVGLVFHNK